LMDSHFNPFVRKLSELPIPIVTAINGAAAGGGCALALAGDIMIAARSAYLLCAFVNIGLVPDMGATWLIAKSAGRATALEMMMLGERMPAEEALKRGVISRVVDDAALAAEAQKVAQRLAHGPTITLGLIRRQVTDSLAGAFDDTLRAEARHQQIASRTSDAHESQQAFREKRPARFTGA
ncbi:MAG: enoyl-CoA hydratase-related protein, partial [Hyphomonadaceae bacterium]